MSKFDFLDRFNKTEQIDIDRIALRELSAILGGDMKFSSLGSFFQIDSAYPPRFVHGSTSLQAVLENHHLALDCFDPKLKGQTSALSQFVFVDAETTGLSSASGTVAFLVGVGFVEDTGFHVQQYFLPDYPDEPAMLEAIADFAEGKKGVVSFNGKCFDLPLLETRYRMQKMETPFTDMIHIDLLHVARRFWRGRFQDTSLQTLEKELLNVYRCDDTPGYLIPQLYFDYLRTGNAEPLNGVLLHNRLDIVTLLFLLSIIQRYLQEADRFDYYSAIDALAIAKHHVKLGQLEKSCEIASRQFSGKIDGEEELSLAMLLFRSQKRSMQIEGALTTLMHLRKAKGEMRLFALNEAAKLNERHLKNFAEAAKLVRDAFEYLDNPISEIPYDRVMFWNETFQKRQTRLLKRLQ